MYNPYYPQQAMYQNQYNPMMNAQQRLAQMEQQYPQFGMSQTPMSGSQSVMQMSLAGRIVDSFENITANDVPMDNVGAIFIKSDGLEIQKRFWGNDGLIKVKSYKEILDEKNENTDILSTSEEKLKSDLSDAFTARFDEVMNKLETIEKSFNGRKAVKNGKSNANDVPTDDE